MASTSAFPASMDTPACAYVKCFDLDSVEAFKALAFHQKSNVAGVFGEKIPMSDVSSKRFAFKCDCINASIRSTHGLLQTVCIRGHGQNTAARGHDIPVRLLCAGMEDDHIYCSCRDTSPATNAWNAPDGVCANSIRLPFE